MDAKLFLFTVICVPPIFTDASLRDFEQKNNKALILVVSDQMPYSQVSAAQIQIEANKRKIPFQLLSDRIGKNQKMRCDPILASNRLFSLGAARHYPTLFFIKNNQLQKKLIPGAQSNQELTLTLNEILGYH